MVISATEIRLDTVVVAGLPEPLSGDALGVGDGVGMFVLPPSTSTPLWDGYWVGRFVGAADVGDELGAVGADDGLGVGEVDEGDELGPVTVGADVGLEVGNEVEASRETPE